MKGKKKKSKKKGKGEEVEDLSTERLYNLYRRKCKEQGVSMCRTLYDQFMDAFDDQEDIPKVGEAISSRFICTMRLGGREQGRFQRH